MSKKVLIITDKSLSINEYESKIIPADFNVIGASLADADLFPRIRELEPAIIIIEIICGNENLSLNIAEEFCKAYSIPFIYILNEYDKNILKKTQLTKPYGLLIKPFDKNNLNAVINTAIDCYGRESGMKDFQNNLVNYIESNFDIIMGLDSIGNITFVDHHIEALIGFPASEIINNSFVNYLHKDDSYFITEFINSKTSNHIRLILRLICHDGHTLWVQGAFYPFFDGGSFSGIRVILRDITEFKLTEERLYKERNYYKNLIEILPFKFFLKDLNFGYISCNSAFAREFNMHPDDIAGMTDYDLYPKQLAELIRANDRKVITEKDNLSSIEKQMENGKYKWIYRFLAKAVDENNEHVGILGFYWDITEKKQLEKELDKSRAVLAKAQEIAHIGSFEFNIENNEINISEEMQKLYGLSSDANLENDFLSKVIPVDMADLIGKVSSSWFEDRLNLEFDNETFVNGGKKFFHIKIEVVQNEEGKSGRIIGTSQDITKIKLAEETLKENQMRLQLSLDAGGAGTWLSDLSSHIITWDRRMQEMLGFYSYVLSDDDNSWKKNIHPDDIAGLEASIIRAVKTGERIEITIRVIKNGNVNYIHSQVEVLKDSSGRTSKLVGICTDVTERVLAKKRDLEINEELERKVNERTQELKFAFEELERKQLALMVSEEQFRSAFVFAMHGMVQVSIEGKILNVNPAICRLLGYEEMELHEMDFTVILQKENHYNRNIFEDLISGRFQSFNMELKLRHKNGKSIWASVSASIVRGTDNRPLRIICQIIDLEDRRKAEQALKISERRFIMAAEISGAGILEYTVPDCSGLYFSERWANILGYTYNTFPWYDDFLKWLYSQVYPDDISIMDKANAELIEGSVETANIEFRIKHRTGKWITIQCLSRAVERDENNKAKRLIKIVTDISDRKRMGDALTFSVKVNEIMFDSTAEEIMQLGLEKGEFLTGSSIGYFHFVNPDQDTIALKTWSNNTKIQCEIGEKTSHYPISEAGIWVDCIHEKKPVMHNDYAGLSNKKGLPAGHVPLIRDLAVPVYSKNKIVAVVGVGNKPEDYNESDVSLLSIIAENTWSAISRKRALEALEESEERYRILMESMSDYTYSAKLYNDGRIETEYINGELKSVSGYTPEELKTFPNGYRDIVEQEDLKLVSDVIPLLLENKSQAVEYRIWNKNGEIRWLRDYIRPVYDDKEKKVTRLIGGIQDITDKKNAEQKLIEQKQEAERESVAKSVFLANMSHEIRTPLNAIIGLSELLRTSVKDKKQQSYLMTINSAGKSLLTLINDILDLSKIEVGMMDLNVVPLNILHLLDEIEKIFKIKILEKGIDFKIQSDDDFPTVLLMDEIRLRQVLLNIVGNAIKFTSKGHIIIKVERQSSHEGGSKIDLMIAVEDTGIGIRREDIKIIFESFKQSKDINKEFGGTGLGLAISKRLVEMMGGEIYVISELGVGSTFMIMFYNVIVGSIDYFPDKSKVINLDVIRFNSEKIIIVDDIESNRIMLKEVLEKVNLVVIEADSGDGCINFAHKYKPELIITDIRMPNMDGFGLIKRLKEDPDTREIPMLAITASVKSAEREKIIKSGFDAYLAKPVDILKLLKEISRFLPYSNIDQGIISSKLNEKWTTEDITDIKNLVKVLKNKIMPGVEKAKGVIRVKDVREIAEQLGKLAGDHHAHALKIYSEKLNDAAKSYDIDNINKGLFEFSSILEKIEEKANSHDSR